MRQPVKSGTCGLLLLCLLFTNCFTAEIYFSSMDVNTGIQSRQILNLRANRFLNNEEKLYGEKLMKSGFLNLSTEEYGYYNIDLKWDSDFGIGLPILSLCTLGILQIFGVPSEVNTYTIVASLEIFDSNGNIVREFKERGTFKQAAGWYYGRDNTKKAGREFSKLFSAIQNSIDDQSAFINKKLMDAGPINSANTETASKNILAYLSAHYDSMSAIGEAFLLPDPVNAAINNSYTALSRNIPGNSIVAIVNFNSENQDELNLLLNELTVLFVNSKKYIIVDRANLEEIKKEQDFQMTGYVDDASIVSIGHFSGADVVITGIISGENEQRRLILKALDVKTAKILAASSEKF